MSCALSADVLDEAGYEPVYKILDRLGLPRSFPDFTTTSYLNGTGFNVARTLALAQRYLSADILVQLSLEPDPGISRSALYVITALFNNYRYCSCMKIRNNFISLLPVFPPKTKKVRLAVLIETCLSCKAASRQNQIARTSYVVLRALRIHIILIITGVSCKFYTTKIIHYA